jgi:predicted ATPase/GAF domain-containing protein/tRNA A-37 threonylcarbamoyl transferase component Bud32
METVYNLKIDGYEILEKLPSQSVRDLYIAQSEKLGKKVIIKNIATSDDLDSSVLNLRNEYEIIKYLEGAIELKVYGFLHHASGYALIMDYFEGPSLKERILSGLVDMDSFYQISIAIAEKIHRIHAKKVIHKDIKPDNIILNVKDVLFIDFGISTRLSRQESSWVSPNVLEGSLPYISPEQTGRMNRSIDYRTDFYSVGVTLYELATGRLPFTSEDPLEIIHSHLAKMPEKPNSIRPEIPETVSKIILKLLSKRAEERYQSARALIADLKRCYEEWKSQGKVEDFQLGEFDSAEEFKIPQKLYGREKEVEILLNEFHHTARSGQSNLILVGGYSGIGKTSLIREIYKPITESKGYFLTGKYDQYSKNIPYSGIIQALTGLVRFMLTESPEKIRLWKSNILTGLGQNGKIITDVIPELVYIIGEQPEVVELSPTENASRFYVVFQNFIKTFTSDQHPLAIFLDDLQWADNSSIDLLKSLLQDHSVKYLFLMISYRDNEIDKVHPLTQFISSLDDEKINYNKILLQPLSVENLIEMLSDALKSEKSKVSNLANIILSKTGGNPFFLNELLKQLIHEELITNASDSIGSWAWDEEKIKNSNISDNVIELLLKRIKKLNPTTQTILKYSSCIGSNFDLEVLRKIANGNSVEFIEGIKETIHEELVNPIGDSFLFLDTIQENLDKNIRLNFKFQHDRIQQACYNLLEENQKKETHLVIARVLYNRVQKKDLEDSLFDIVSHYNQASDLITDKNEIQELISLNIKAASKAKLSSAYAPALEMIMHALSLSQKVELDRSKKLDLFFDVAELEYLNGNLEQSEKFALLALEETDEPTIKASIRGLLITQFSALGQYDKALENINLALEPLGMNLPSNNFQKIIEEDIAFIASKLEGKKIKSLYNLPEMVNPVAKAAVKILTSAIPTAYNKSLELFPIISLKMVKLHLEHGNLGDSYGYSMYGIVLNNMGEYQQAYEFCDLAVNLSEKYKNPSGLTKACNILANYAIPFVRHIKYSEEVNGKCVRSSLDSGELLHGSYGAMNDCVNIFFQGKRLDKVTEKLDALYSFTKKVKSNLAIDTVEAVRMIIPNLRGEVASHLDFQSADLTETQFLDLCYSHQSLFPVCLYKIMKARTLIAYNEFTKALLELEESAPMLANINGQYPVIEHNFCTSLALVQLYKTFSMEKRKEVLTKIKENQKVLKNLSKTSPENFLHKFLIIEAELARITYKNWKAAKFYDSAIVEARKNDFIQNEALFSEIAAKFWLSKGNTKIAAQYIQESYQRYKAWGAERKCTIMSEQYSDFLSESKKITTSISRPAHSISQTELYSGQTLDIQSVLKSSNAISSEIQLESLFSKLLQILMENAGAEKGILLLKQDKEFTIEALGDVKEETVKILPSEPLQNYKEIPSSVVYYVARTKENLVIANGFQDERFSSDLYIHENKTKSILCAPILKQGEIKGILYLENNLTEGAFTSDRLQIVNMLSSQAAISLDNAQLYNKLEEKVKERTLQLAQVNQELAEKNKHITDSIKYAQNIQFAILPSYSELKASFKDVFVFYRPKDIVSGDFYWFNKTENYILIAAVDCTGHGVPGALMSMIGNTLLNQIVNEKNITDPGKILTMLNQKVRSVLRQDSDDANSTDGMDICLCKVERDHIYFAGAKRPVYIVVDGVLEEYKCDRFSIGGRQNGTREFSTFTREIPKDKKLSVYLTTDGYGDQPNKDRTKIGSKNLQALLVKNSGSSCWEQFQELAIYLDNHSGAEAQRDDITILGFTP